MLRPSCDISLLWLENLRGCREIVYLTIIEFRAVMTMESTTVNYVLLFSQLFHLTFSLKLCFQKVFCFNEIYSLRLSECAPISLLQIHKLAAHILWSFIFSSSSSLQHSQHKNALFCFLQSLTFHIFTQPVEEAISNFLLGCSFTTPSFQTI